MYSDEFYGSTTFYITAVTSFIIYAFLVRLLLMRRKHKALNVVTTTSGLIIFAMGLINSIIAYSYARYKYPESITFQEQSLFALAYTIYFVLWILGNNYFLNKIARIPPHRRTQFRMINIIMNIEIVITAMLAVIFSNIIPSARETFGFTENNGRVEIVFVVVSQIALITFVYFNRALKNEQTNNASKLIKARLQLLRYAIQAQILLSIVIGVFAFLIVMAQFQGLLLEFGLFGSMSVLSLTTALIVYSSINIPNRVRVRFNIAPKRFNYIVRAGAR
jgi:hypothetical protein